ncbi:hypothetical protein V6N13_068511 [Hibiscus sabdariffa]
MTHGGSNKTTTRQRQRLMDEWFWIQADGEAQILPHKGFSLHRIFGVLVFFSGLRWRRRRIEAIPFEELSNTSEVPSLAGVDVGSSIFFENPNPIFLVFFFLNTLPTLNGGHWLRARPCGEWL